MFNPQGINNILGIYCIFKTKEYVERFKYRTKK